MVEAGTDHLGVPAKLWLPVVQGLNPMYFFSRSLLVNGTRLSPEPARQIAVFSIVFPKFARFLQSGHLVFATSALASASVRTSLRFSSEYFVQSFQVTELFLHLRYIPLHNSQWPFWASVSLMSARQDDIIWIFDLISEVRHFKVVIRLRNVKQSAFFRFSLFTQSVDGWTAGRRAWHHPFWLACHDCCRNRSKQSFFQLCPREYGTRHSCNMLELPGRSMTLGVVLLFFYGFWWGSIVHLIH